MSRLAHRRVLVAGAGVIGSSTALSLARAGAEVYLIDPAPLGDNASGVAAGMLAPAFEAALDSAAADHFELLSEARDLWPAFAEQLGADHIGLRRSGGLWIASPEDPPAMIDAHQAALGALGVAVERLSPARVRERAPEVRADVGEGLWTTSDWRLDPLAALGRLHGAARDAGVVVVSGRLAAFDGGVGRLTDDRTLSADLLVIATGAAVADVAPELGVLTPIKGHILRFPDVVSSPGRPTLRWSGGYALAGPSGLTVGATMEPGLNDRRIDAAIVERLRRIAIDLYPGLDGARVIAQAGVRAAAPDGLPLVGPSVRRDVILAVGVRRNGWLLAPLIADMVAAYAAGGEPACFGALMNPRRFAAD